MAITNGELVLRPSAAITGGRMAATEIVSNLKNNVWPNITEQDRTNGVTLRRKLHYHVAHPGMTEFSNVRVVLPSTTPGDGLAFVRAGTFTDVAADLTGSERKYGCGKLVANVSSGATSVQLDLEPGGGTLALIQAGDVLYLSDGTHTEFAEVDTVSYSTDRATIILVAGLQYGYSAATPTYAASCLTVASVVAVASTPVITGTVTFDHVTAPIQVDGIGTIADSITVEFTSATNFTVTSALKGSLGSGSVGVNFTAVNPDFSQPYFTIPAAGWGGTATTGDTLEFDTAPAAVPFWVDLVIPAGAGITVDQSETAIFGESV